MDTDAQTPVVIRRLYELLIVGLIGVGLILIVVSFLIPSEAAQDVVRGVGLSLFPVGLVSFFLSRFAASITRMLLKETVENSIDIRLREHMADIENSVDSGLGKIDEEIRNGLDETKKAMQRFSPLFASCAELGLERLHLTRAVALDDFAWFLDGEVRKARRKEPAFVWIVASSLKGFLEATTQHFDGLRMMERIVESGCGTRILMTDLNKANFRAEQERRAPDDIPNEIKMNLRKLKDIGVTRESIRFYPGTPTVFAIATTDRMLLNPYPYQREAFRCCTFVAYRTLNKDADIYHQYLESHFQEPWEAATVVSPRLWDGLVGGHSQSPGSSEA